MPGSAPTGRVRRDVGVRHLGEGIDARPLAWISQT
jgi:hypothetical protein